MVSQHGRIGIGSGFMGQLEPFKRCSLYTRFSAHICCQATTLAGFPQLLKPPLKLLKYVESTEAMLCSQSSYALGVMAGSLLANVHILTKLFEILAGHKGIKKNWRPGLHIKQVRLSDCSSPGPSAMHSWYAYHVGATFADLGLESRCRRLQEHHYVYKGLAATCQASDLKSIGKDCNVRKMRSLSVPRLCSISRWTT